MDTDNLSPIVVVGLGNPKESYNGTRHNIGRDFITQTIPSHQKLNQSRQADFFRESAFLFVKLRCYMNESGGPIKGLLMSEKIPPQKLVILVDDFMIPFGTLRLRMKGSAGGHNGLKSIIEVLGTEDFGRLRMGVGPVPEGLDPADYVLDKFTKQEMKQKSALYDAVSQGLAVLQKEGYQKAMAFLNKSHF